MQGPANSDADASITATATTTDADGSTATSAPVAVNVVVNPVSDTPVLAAPAASGEEDTFILFGDKATWTKPDADGSERISRVEVTGFGAATRAIHRDGRGERHGDCRRLCHHRTVRGRDPRHARHLRRAADHNSDTDLTLTIRAQTTDGVASPSAFATITQSILVDAQADAPVLAVGAIAGNEDTAVPFGNAITWTKPDADGSEWISQVTLSGFPAGWVVSFTPNAAVTVTGPRRPAIRLHRSPGQRGGAQGRAR